MDTWKTLIDTAAELCGSQNRLAQRLGYDPSQLSRVKRGAPMPLTMAGELADVLGPDYDAAIARCLTEQEPPGRKRDAVARLLRVPATLAAALITSATLISPDISQAKAHATGDALRGFVSYVNSQSNNNRELRLPQWAGCCGPSSCATTSPSRTSGARSTPC